MKRAYLILALALLAGVSACKKDSSTSSVLIDQEALDLKFMREEEKLARDVYLYAFELYGSNVFENIAASESKHMESIRQLLEKYGYNDPAAGMAPGEFMNDDLQDLYEVLTMEVAVSLTNAFTIGATIEDLDINDLDVASTHTTKNDLLNVYNNLTCGSRNHLRSFYSQLEGDYQPQYIDQDSFDSIVNSGNEQCGND